MPSAWLGEAVNEIIERFEGVTFERKKIEGRWREVGKVYKDVLTRVIVDVPDTSRNRIWMRRYKAKWKKKLQQIELWMVSHRVEIEK